MAKEMYNKPKDNRKRGNPTAQVGNYASEVDTAGMDPEMKHTMNVAKARKPRGILGMLKELRNRGKK